MDATRTAALAILGALLCAAPAHPQGLSTVRVVRGLQAPVFVTAPPIPGDDRLFVLELTGRVRVVQDGVLLSDPFLDLTRDCETRDCVGTASEGGLLGLAFSPDYASDGRFWVYWTVDDPSAPSPWNLESRVSRFLVQGDPATSNQADRDSEQVWYQLDQPYGNHNGGTIAIRGDFLYLGLGDGGSGGDPLEAGQDDATDLGKLLRFDWTESEPAAPERWAKGFRNPYRFSFDSETGDLYVGDVGQGSWEEIDVQPAAAPAGENFGWDVEEGSACFDPDRNEPPCGDPTLVGPTYEYPHANQQCGGSVTGGVVYRGSAIPSLRGHYFFADYCLDEIWSFVWDPEAAQQTVVSRTADFAPDAGSIRSVAGFGEDADGELYVVDIEGGELFRLVPEPGGAALRLAALAGLAVAGVLRRPPG